MCVAIILDRGCAGRWERGEMTEPRGQGQGNDDCRVVIQMLDRIGDKWTVLVVDALQDGPVRFNALMRSVDGISHRMLTLTLRSLEADGLVLRTAYATIPPRVDYALTELGRSLIEPLAALAIWVKQNRSAIEKARMRYQARVTDPLVADGHP
jgi:DNA-binding HxlR family transcriptional regulator